MFDYVFVTHLPAFYKVNLYNELSKYLKIYAIFIGSASKERTKDFVTLTCSFEYVLLDNDKFETRDKIASLIELYKTIKSIDYRKIIVGGWDLPEFWLLVMLNRKVRNCLALESTVLESGSSGLKKIIKKLFLNRISTVFASGNLHVELLETLNYSGNTCITRGVGVINKPLVELKIKDYQKKFLFLGRLSVEKNLNFLINIFNNLSGYQLTLVGNGPLCDELHALAKPNIIFYSHVDNNNLSELFNAHDFLILPSLSETWGLVVEEALYYGVPVIVSDHCGASELVVNNKNGFIFSPQSVSQFESIIKSIDFESYKLIQQEVIKMKTYKKDETQIRVYLDALLS